MTSRKISYTILLCLLNVFAFNAESTNRSLASANPTVIDQASTDELTNYPDIVWSGNVDSDSVEDSFEIDPNCDLLAYNDVEMLNCDILSLYYKHVTLDVVDKIKLSEDISPLMAQAVQRQRGLMHLFSDLSTSCRNIGWMLKDILLLNNQPHNTEAEKSQRCSVAYKSIVMLREMNFQLSKLIHRTQFVHEDISSCNVDLTPGAEANPEAPEVQPDSGGEAVEDLTIPSVDICHFGGLSAFVNFASSRDNDVATNSNVSMFFMAMDFLGRGLFKADFRNMELIVFDTWSEVLLREIPDYVTSDGAYSKESANTLHESFHHDLMTFATTYEPKLKEFRVLAKTIHSEILSLGTDDVTLDTILSHMGELRKVHEVTQMINDYTNRMIGTRDLILTNLRPALEHVYMTPSRNPNVPELGRLHTILLKLGAAVNDFFEDFKMASEISTQFTEADALYRQEFNAEPNSTHEATLNIANAFYEPLNAVIVFFPAYANAVVKSIDYIQLSVFELEKHILDDQAEEIRLIELILDFQTKIASLHRMYTSNIQKISESLADAANGLETTESLLIRTDPMYVSAELVTKVKEAIAAIDGCVQFILDSSSKSVKELSAYGLTKLFFTLDQNAILSGSVDQWDKANESNVRLYVSSLNSYADWITELQDLYGQLQVAAYQSETATARFDKITSIKTNVDAIRAPLDLLRGEVALVETDFDLQATKAAKNILTNELPRASVDSDVISYDIELQWLNKVGLPVSERFQSVVFFDPYESTVTDIARDVLLPTDEITKATSQSDVPHLRLSYKHNHTRILLGEKIVDSDRIYSIQLNAHLKMPVFIGLGYAVKSRTGDAHYLRGAFFKTFMEKNEVMKVEMATYLNRHKTFTIVLFDSVMSHKIVINDIPSFSVLRPTVVLKSAGHVDLSPVQGMLVEVVPSLGDSRTNYAPYSYIKHIKMVDLKLKAPATYEYTYKADDNVHRFIAIGLYYISDTLNLEPKSKIATGIFFDGRHIYYDLSSVFLNSSGSSSESSEGHLFMQLHLQVDSDSHICFWSAKDPKNPKTVYISNGGIMNVGVLHTEADFAGLVSRSSDISKIPKTQVACTATANCAVGICTGHAKEVKFTFGFCEAGYLGSFSALILGFFLLLACGVAGFGIYHVVYRCCRDNGAKEHLETKANLEDTMVGDEGYGDNQKASLFTQKTYDYL